MVPKQLIVAVFLLVSDFPILTDVNEPSWVSWARRDRADDFLDLPRDMADQCIRNGGVEALDNVKRALNQIKTSYNNLADWNKLVQEIEEAERLDGSVNQVFENYCSKKPEFVECITELTKSLKPCYEEGEHAQGNLDVIRNVVDQLLYICEQDGAMPMAIIAGGAQCLDGLDTAAVLAGCLASVDPINTIINVIDIDFDDSTCANLNELEECVVQELKSCDLDVGNTAQSLIRTILTSTPCKDRPNSASGLTVTILSSLMAASCLLLM